MRKDLLTVVYNKLTDITNKFAEKLRHSDLSAATGCLEKFKKRLDIYSEPTHVKNAQVDPKLVDERSTNLTNLTKVCQSNSTQKP